MAAKICGSHGRGTSRNKPWIRTKFSTQVQGPLKKMDGIAINGTGLL